MSEKPKTASSELVQVLVGIVRMQRGPEDLPAATGVLVAVVLASVIPSWLLLSLLPTPFEGNIAALIAVRIAATLAWISLVLRLAAKPERATQTLIAVFGSQLVLAPVFIFSGWFLAAYGEDPSLQLPALALRLVVEVWVLVVLARILRSATEWPMFACVLVAVANEVLALLVIGSLFVQPQTAVAPV